LKIEAHTVLVVPVLVSLGIVLMLIFPGSRKLASLLKGAWYYENVCASVIPLDVNAFTRFAGLNVVSVPTNRDGTPT